MIGRALALAGALVWPAIPSMYSFDGYDPGASMGCHQLGNVTRWDCPPAHPDPAPRTEHRPYQPSRPELLRASARLLRQAAEKAEKNPAAARADATLAIDKLTAALTRQQQEHR